MARPKKTSDEIRLSASAMLLPETYETIMNLTEKTGRSRSQVLEMLVLYGIDAMNRHGMNDPVELIWKMDAESSPGYKQIGQAHNRQEARTLAKKNR